MVVFGGSSDTGEANNQLYSLNLSKEGSKWTLISTSRAPAPRYGMSGFIHQNRIYVFGGYNKKIEKVFNDLWMLDLDTFQWERSQLKGWNRSLKSGLK